MRVFSFNFGEREREAAVVDVVRGSLLIWMIEWVLYINLSCVFNFSFIVRVYEKRRKRLSWMSYFIVN